MFKARQLRLLLGRLLYRVFPPPPPPPRPAKADYYRRLGATIGVNTRIYGTIDGVNPHLVTIGDHCVVGVQSAVLAHCPIRGPQPVTIGNEVWIGFNALILPGVTIADRCIIGAGAVVTKDLPAGCIAVGNPARVLRVLAPEESRSLSERLRSGEKMGKDAGHD